MDGPADNRQDGDPADDRDGGGPADQPTDDRHLPVLAGPEVVGEIEAVEARPVDRPPEAGLPTPLAAAAGGFVAGFLAVLLARLLRGRGAGLALGGSRGRRAIEREITSSRSFLVDVHVLKR